MKCHYEVLGVAMDATPDDLKIAYRKLALQWHPDKNLSRLQEATQQFQLIQQAYEVLSDPQERAWYDKHRDAILQGGLGEDYKDDSINVFQYFNSSCYAGYNDDEKGFYTVYRDVFDKIAAEDRPYLDNDNMDFPSFGSSDSSYEEVVHLFYSFWQSYCTSKTYYWLDPYDTRQAPNRRVARLMEKENKKLRDAAKKSRSEEVRELVQFVRKRDKRVQAYKKLLEEKAAENARKAEEQRKKQIREKQKYLSEYKESEWSSMTQVEKDLKEIEAQLDAESENEDAADSCEEYGSDDDYANNLYCVACDKAFKSQKAFLNHETSKKHKENIQLLKDTMQEEEQEFLNTANKDNEIGSEEGESLTDELNLLSVLEKKEPLPKTKKKKKKNRNRSPVEEEEQYEVLETINTKANSEVPVESIDDDEATNTEETKNDTQQSKPKLKGKKAKDARKKAREEQQQQQQEQESVNKKISTFCETCRTNFSSRNKLFDHLKATGHAVYLENAKDQHVDECHKKKGKLKRQN